MTYILISGNIKTVRAENLTRKEDKMMTLYDFIQLAIENDYKINIFDTETGEEVAHQVELNEISDDLLERCIASWDIDYITKEFCINIE